MSLLSWIFIELGGNVIEFSISLLKVMSDVNLVGRYVLKRKFFKRNFYRKGIHIYICRWISQCTIKWTFVFYQSKLNEYVMVSETETFLNGAIDLQNKCILKLTTDLLIHVIHVTSWIFQKKMCFFLLTMIHLFRSLYWHLT